MKRTLPWLALVMAVGWLMPAAHAQRRPYIGYTYPAGGQQATTFQIKLGGQDLDDLQSVRVSGTGVSARILEYYRKLGPQEIQVLNEQLKELKRAPAPAANTMAAMEPAMTADGAAMMMSAGPDKKPKASAARESHAELIARLEQRTREWVQTPACSSISNLVIAEITISPEAEAGTRELRLVTARGVSNPLVFQVGQHAEYTRKPMVTANLQILGKEGLALRKRPAAEVEDLISTPCTVNGQIASGEVNRYRFAATKGQRLVISTQARQLIPYIADAVPGWFQPVLAVYDARGKELAFADDYRFKPDPVILFEVPADGDYVFAIYDSIYRGREDFVYRITIGELPFVTSVFPLGGPMGAALPPNLTGWNLQASDLAALPRSATPGVGRVAASRMGYDSNSLPFALDRLPEAIDREPNNTVATAQRVTLPLVVNGRIDRPDDVDVYQFTGKANQMLVADVQARRLDSPLDAVVRLTDATGKLIAFNDDREDLTAGVNTHPADSWFTAKLPADGIYFVQIGDTARHGGEEYGYRLRLSEPQPDFELRTVPSSVSLPVNSTTSLTVYAVRKDGYTGPIKLSAKNLPEGCSAAPVILPANQTVARLNLKAGPKPSPSPVSIGIVGSAKIGAEEVVREAVPAEDRMQAFLWRHLVPAGDLPLLVFDPKATLVARRVAPPPRPVAALPAPATTSTTAATAPPKPKFSKQQIVGRLRQLKLLYEEGLFTDEFYLEKVAECEVPQ